jgi:hypothetical protein
MIQLCGPPCRLEALRWVHLLLGRAREQVLEALPALMPALLDALVAQVGWGAHDMPHQSLYLMPVHLKHTAVPQG